MKNQTLFILWALLLTLASCIQKEALNSEAAIDACTGSEVQTALINPETKEINIYVNATTDLSRLALTFTIPEGATIATTDAQLPDGDGTYDFSGDGHIRHFRVTSEDGRYTSEWRLYAIPSTLPTEYYFETLDAQTPYHVFKEFNPRTNETLIWSSGNPGFRMTGMAQQPTDYPTLQSTTGYRGKGAKLVTRDTGSFGAMMKMYIAAGNLFIGTFNVLDALSGEGAPKATKFGVQFYKHPQLLRGFYKYEAGAVYKEGETEHPEIQDRFDIYAIFYEAGENAFMLDGTNALTSDRLVAVAQIPAAEALPTSEWTPFELPFELKPGKHIDEETLRSGGYKLGIVFSSSVDGAYFKGAVGSTLEIDEVELICQENP
ncbi:MAG: PCMD domain-containing protein [Prevotellaceae bacterium]|jgi:hypothetical protein|nr:PCMD domain-containing protein [Prevotellaceae bacterium]